MIDNLTHAYQHLIRSLLFLQLCSCPASDIQWAYADGPSIYIAHLVVQEFSRVPFMTYGGTFVPIAKAITIHFVTIDICASFPVTTPHDKTYYVLFFGQNLDIFMALCNSGVLTIQHDIDSLCEATLLSMCPYVDGLKRSVIYDNDEPFSSTSSTSNSLDSLPNTPPHLSPSLPVPVWDMSAILPSSHWWLLPPSTPAAAVVVSMAIGATASVGISFGVGSITRHADDYFQLGIKSHEYCFTGYPPGQRRYRNLDNLDMTLMSQPPHLDAEPSHSLASSHSFTNLACSPDGSRMQKLTEKG